MLSIHTEMLVREIVDEVAIQFYLRGSSSNNDDFVLTRDGKSIKWIENKGLGIFVVVPQTYFTVYKNFLKNLLLSLNTIRILHLYISY